jgi:hypothetical protein
MSSEQPDDQAPQELDDDAGMNAIRLDAERAREELDKTLSEIERRLDPHRFIQPISRAVKQTASAIKTEFQKDPVRFVTVAVLTVGAVGLVLTWAGGGIGSAKTGSSNTASTKNRPAKSGKQTTPGLPKGRSDWNDSSADRSAAAKANKVSKRAVLTVVKSRL